LVSGILCQNTKSNEWELKVAGQRVQIIKKDKEQGGTLEFGTDVVHSKDGKITALLGASPGASTAVHIMIDVLKIAFPEKLKQSAIKQKLDEMIPFWNREITEENKEEFREIQKKTSELLELDVLH
jgi:malate dehydrogenase (quinone)